MYLPSTLLLSLVVAGSRSSLAAAAAVPHDLVKRAANLRAFDVSGPQAGYNPDFWACVTEAGYGKAVIRAYQQACGVVSVFP